MQWDDMRYFLALARHGSLSGTSRMLSVEHSTVARRVGALEEVLQVKLFDRLARGWVLTPEGRELFRGACAVEEEVLAFQRMAVGTATVAGTVRLSAPPLLMSHFLMPHSDVLREQYPQITLELIGERREANLVRGEADIAVRLGWPDETGLVARSIGEVSYGLYGIAREVTRPELAQVYIGFDDSLPGLPQKQWLDDHVGSRPYSVRSNDMMTMLQAACRGWGIAMLPHFLVRKYGQLERLRTLPSPPHRPVYLVMHPDLRRSPRVRVVADSVIEIFRQHANELREPADANPSPCA